MGYFVVVIKMEYNWNELNSYILYIILSLIYYRCIGYKCLEELILLYVKIIKLCF